MRRPITLFTGQWADLPFEEVARLAAGWGYDGLEIACWGDHFDPWAAVEDPAYIRFLIDEFHDISFKEAKVEGKDGTPSTYDQARYINLMKARIKKQLAQPDAALMKKWESRKKK